MSTTTASRPSIAARGARPSLTRSGDIGIKITSAHIPPRIEEAKYYHGLLSAEECASLLNKPGDFLVRARLKDVTQERQLIVSAMTRMGIRHKYVIERRIGVTLTGNRHFIGVPQMIQYYIETRRAIRKHGDEPPFHLRLGIERPSFLLPNHEIAYERRLGKGQYGDVYLGSIPTHRISKHGELTRTTVALKMAQESNDEARLAMMHEAKRMLHYRHGNIVKCHGVAADNAPLTIVLEYCANGSLDVHLRRTLIDEKRPSVLRRMNWARHIASAMTYLWNKHKGIHRDLATRNILLDGAFRAKLADFGLSRHLEASTLVYDTVGTQKMPIRWMAPECFSVDAATKSGGVRFTTKTDVFSFGMLLWEMEHSAALPWGSHVSNVDVIARVLKGQRPLITSVDTNRDVQMLMHKCWHQAAEDRPLFDRLHATLMSMCRRQREKQLSGVDDVRPNDRTQKSESAKPSNKSKKRKQL